MGAEAGGVARAAHVANDELMGGVPEMELGLEASVVHVAFGKAVADEHDALAGRRGRDRL